MRGGLGLGNVTIGLGLVFLDDLLGLRGGLWLGDVTLGLGLVLLDDKDDEDDEELLCQESMLTAFGENSGKKGFDPEGVELQSQNL